MSKKLGQDFAWKLRYQNTLPSQPFEPKLVDFPFAVDRDYRYNPTSLYDTAPLPLYHVQDLNFLKMGLFDLPDSGNVRLDEKDRLLLAKPATNEKKDRKIVSAPRPTVPWLRRTEYISSEQKRSGIQPTLSASSRDLRVSTEDSRESLIFAINRSFDFDDNLENLRHPTNKKLRAVESMPCFPDFELWPTEYSHAVFDTHPTGANGSNAAQSELEDVQAQESILKEMSNPRSKQSFVSFYIPTRDSAGKIVHRQRAQDQELDDEDLGSYDYAHLRDFDTEMKQDTQNRTLFLLIKQKEAAFYHYMNGKINLKRSRAKGKTGRVETRVEVPSKIVLNKRPFEKEEKEDRALKRRMIAPEDEDE